MTCDAYKPLLMAYLDREVAAVEQTRIERHLEECDACRGELESFRRLKEVTKEMRVHTPDDKYWEAYWSNVYNRLERKAGWILVSIGAILLGSYALYGLIMEAFFDYQIPVIIRVGILALAIGFCTLLVSVVRERLFLSKSDKYERIKR